MLNSDHQTRSANCYFARPPERLVLDGSRLWLMGVIHEEWRFFNDAACLYREILGAHLADYAVQELDRFVNTLGRCALCPLKAFPPGVRHICRDEVLLLGLVSAIQHGDDPSTQTCLNALTCPGRCEEAAMAAASFAIMLRSAGQKLACIPLSAIEDILVKSGSVTVH
jgi:hypothetical protein